MGRKMYTDMAAEREAIEVGKKFMNSSDVVADMSRAYGADLSSVRIHADRDSHRKTAERGVDAFSTGKEIYFAKGAYDKNDPASRGLLAHELSHSLQQGIGGELSGMENAAPIGAEQGGFLDWFRSLFSKKKNKEDEINLREKNEASPGLNPKMLLREGNAVGVSTHDLVKNHMDQENMDPNSVYTNSRENLKSDLGNRYSGDVDARLYTANMMNASGTVKINGLVPGRVVSNLVGAAGGTRTNEEITQMYDNIMSGGKAAILSNVIKGGRGVDGKLRKNALDAQTELNENYTKEDIAARDQKFDVGIYQLKALYLEQLRRIKEKYGTYITQMHPEDFLSKVGFSYFDDMSIMQDVVQLLTDGKKYFDFENNPEDAEFKRLTDYYFNASNILNTYVGADMSTENEFNPDEYNLQYFENTEYLDNAYNLESQIGGPGFTKREHKGYVKRLQKRFEGEGKLARLFKRFRKR